MKFVTMKSLAILLLATLVASVSCQAESRDQDQEVAACRPNKWKLFKSKFSKRYQDELEDKRRFAIFCRNLQLIAEHNSQPEATYQMGVNHFTDRTEQELLQNGFVFPEANKTSFKLQGALQATEPLIESLLGYQLKDDLPEEVDWSKDPTRVSAVRDQGYCGSCWAFTIVGLLEGQEKPQNGSKVTPLSEQNLVDCDKKNFGCGGGFFEPALDEIIRSGGVMPLSEYPYVSGQTRRNGTCKMDKKLAYKSTTKLGKTVRLTLNNEPLLRKTVATYGPVAVAIESGLDLHAYKKGIYYKQKNRDPRLNHAVLLVGYGIEKSSNQKFWKIKNSWGADWGMDGYALMARGKIEDAGLGSNAVISLPVS